MDDTTKNIQSTIDTFNNLTDEDFAAIENLNTRIQAHKGPWGEMLGGTKDESGVIEMPYSSPHPLISEFVQFMYDKDLILIFDWGLWDEGREWFMNSDESKYDRLDTETCLKLLTAVIRNDRFHDGALIAAFESGDFPKIIDQLVKLGNAETKSVRCKDA